MYSYFMTGGTVIATQLLTITFSFLLLVGPYTAPEIYKDEIFDRSVDVYAFGVLLYEMMEGTPPFHPKSPEEAARLMCKEGKRPSFKSKSKYPPDLKELIEECWHLDSFVRPTFSEIIVRMDKIVANCSKHGWLKDTLKLPW
nr:PREDICTED: serine/threonine-protein kinase HT1-like [Nicotiana sylvestris]